MRVVKQPVDFFIKNYDSVDETNSEIQRHSPLLPNYIRALIVGPSGCGKTNVLLSLLENPNGLRFENIYLYTKSSFQPKYIYLKNLINEVKDVGYYEFNNSSDIISPSETNSNSIIIFDDICCSSQAIIREYFSMGRHSAVDSFFLCQTYSHISKHLVRDNANLIVLFKQDDLNLKHVYSDHISGDMKYSQFLSMCWMCWKPPFGFLVIDKEKPLNAGRYRQGFDSFIYL